MKIKTKFKHFLLGASIAAIGLQAASFALPQDILGDFRTLHVERAYVLPHSDGLLDPAVAAPIIEAYINQYFPNRANAHVGDISTRDLAVRIAGVSHCFNIDPFVYTALIQKESSFIQRSVSEGFAYGFTQFTNDAVLEVNDQLGMRGLGQGRAEVKEYFDNILRGNCLEVFGGYKEFGANYNHLWDEGRAAALADGSAAQNTAIKKMFSSHPELGLVYGAIFMKVQFSKVKSGLRTGCIASNKNKSLSIEDQFKETMMLYNSDGCYTQLDYQKKIMKFYTAIMQIAGKAL